MGIIKGVPEEVKQHRKLLAAKREIKYLKESRVIDKKGLDGRDKIIQDLNILVKEMQESNKTLLSLVGQQQEINRELVEGKPEKQEMHYIN